jgi:hypothetical protein
VKTSDGESGEVPVGLFTTTFTRPWGWGGEMARSEVTLVTVTLVAGVVPKLTAVVSVNPLPWTTTPVPPEVGPVAGEIAVTIGGTAVPRRGRTGGSE